MAPRSGLKALFSSLTCALALAWLPLGKAYALDPALAESLFWETNANSHFRLADQGRGSWRSSARFTLSHFEIPLEALKYEISQLDPLVRQALLVTKNGKEYVRWIINPDDTKWANQVEAWLRKKGYDAKRYQYFDAYRTASRTLVIEEPVTGTVFAGKVSTNEVNGVWNDKPFYADQARQAYYASQYLKSVKESAPMKNVLLLEEQAFFALDAIKQGMVIRSLDVYKSGYHYLPAFSALDERVGLEIAKRPLSQELLLEYRRTIPDLEMLKRYINDFWKEHLIKALARAMAEYTAHSGMASRSGHIQDYTIELDAEFHPTGRILFKDPGDGSLFVPFFRKSDPYRLLPVWRPGSVYHDRLEIRTGPLRFGAIVLPRWLSTRSDRDWRTGFRDEYLKAFSENTGLPLSSLSAKQLVSKENDWTLSIQKKGLEPWIKRAAELQGRPGFGTHLRVPFLECVRMYLKQGRWN